MINFWAKPFGWVIPDSGMDASEILGIGSLKFDLNSHWLNPGTRRTSSLGLKGNSIICFFTVVEVLRNPGGSIRKIGICLAFTGFFTCEKSVMGGFVNVVP